MDCIKTVVTIIIQRQIPFHRCLQNLMTSGIASLAFPKSSALKTCTMPESIIRDGPQFHHRRHFAFMHKRLCDKFNHRWCYGLSMITISHLISAGCSTTIVLKYSAVLNLPPQPQSQPKVAKVIGAIITNR